MVRVTTKRMVLGGSMHGQVVSILHGSTMRSAASGDVYKRHGILWWVPIDDGDEDADRRVKSFKDERRAMQLSK